MSCPVPFYSVLLLSIILNFFPLRSSLFNSFLLHFSPFPSTPFRSSLICLPHSVSICFILLRSISLFPILLLSVILCCVLLHSVRSFIISFPFYSSPFHWFLFHDSPFHSILLHPVPFFSNPQSSFRFVLNLNALLHTFWGFVNTLFNIFHILRRSFWLIFFLFYKSNNCKIFKPTLCLGVRCMCVC